MLKENNLLKQVNSDELLIVDGGKSLVCIDLNLSYLPILAVAREGITSVLHTFAG